MITARGNGFLLLIQTSDQSAQCHERTVADRGRRQTPSILAQRKRVPIGGRSLDMIIQVIIYLV